MNFFNLKPGSMKVLDALACDLMKRNTKEFTELDISRLGYAQTWQDIKNAIETDSLPLFIKTEIVSSTLSVSSDDDEEMMLSVDGEEGIGEVRDMPLFDRRTFTDGALARSMPVNVFQRDLNAMASFESVPTNDITSISFILNNPISVYRFKHLRFIEILIARFLYNKIQDSITRISHTVLMESTAFQRAFDIALPKSFFFSRSYKEVLLIMVTLLNESTFENFLKYLFNFKNSLEHCDVAFRVLKERGRPNLYRPFYNKLTQIRNSLALSQFKLGFAHPSGIVRRLSKSELISSG
jgi:hypothetical protein